MLTKILNVEGVGLLHNVKGADKYPFGKVTLVYAENGRGKSTLASILTSCSTRDADLIEDRITIDGDVKPSVKLLFQNATAEYADGNWTGYQPEVLVYDTHFVNSNVHTGNEVTTNQRANLLSFALGASAVQAQRQEQASTLAGKQANDLVKELRQRLEAVISGKMPVAQFRALREDPDVDNKISNAEQRLTELARIVEIKRQAVPQEYALPSLDVAKVFAMLNTTLESVHAEAAAKVSEHLAHLNDANSVSWIQRGLAIAVDDECPFCGQDTSTNELIGMYRTYFDKSYTELQDSFEEVTSYALAQTDPSHTRGLVDGRSRNNDALEHWSEYVDVAQLDDARDDLAQASLTNLRDILETLFARKASSITEAHGSEEEEKDIERLWSQYVGIYEEENSAIRAYLDMIEKYKNALEASDIDQVQMELDSHRLVRLRHTDEVSTLIDELVAAEGSLKDAETAKKNARDQLNGIMQSTLSQFREQINSHLDAFNAEFQIAELSHNYRGQTPRVEYQIRLRGKAIELAGGRPTFSTALSEGDKKTMGFAFFAASTLADTELDKKVVVIDDPMSSLDTPRREHTVKVLVDLALRAKQLIILAHDEHFLRSARDRIRAKDNSIQINEVSLLMSEGQYSEIGSLHLDQLCQSDYLKNYNLVSGVVSGKINEPLQVAHGAVALRLLLEGYLHRKYPDIIPIGVTLGKAITSIEESDGTSSPCASMVARVPELREMNDYASKFHHETQPDYEAAKGADHREISRNGQRILDFIHSA